MQVMLIDMEMDVKKTGKKNKTERHIWLHVYGQSIRKEKSLSMRQSLIIYIWSRKWRLTQAFMSYFLYLS